MLDEDSASYAWLRENLQGASAKAIAAHLGGWGQQDGWYPMDAGDFGRCEALLDAVPEFRARLAEMAEVNAYWHALVLVWDGLRQHSPDALTTALRGILSPIEALDPTCARYAHGSLIRFRTEVTFSHQDFIAALAAKGGRVPMKETPEDKAVRDQAYSVTAEELRQFIERFEHLEAEKKDIAEQQKEVMAEAKGRGYDTKVLRKVIALRKRKPDEIAEEEAVLELYKAALGMG